MTADAPKPEHKFTFGLWMAGNVNRNLSGGPVREAKSPVELVRQFAEVGMWSVNFQESVLVPNGAPPAERDCIVRDFKAASSEMSAAIAMMTTNLFNDPAFADSVFTSDAPKMRACACNETRTLLN
jgi:xylose isomerase